MLTVLIGPPACGKTTWALASGGRHIASDDVRAAMTGDVADHSRDAVVAERFDAAVLAAVAASESVIVENGANARRASYLTAARAHGLPTRVVLFENYSVALTRALRRASPPMTEDEWRPLAEQARAAAAVVRSEGWDAVVCPD